LSESLFYTGLVSMAGHPNTFLTASYFQIQVFSFTMTLHSSKSHRSGERDSQRQSQGASTQGNAGHNAREAVSRGRSKDHNGHSRRRTPGSTTEEDDSPGPALTNKRPAPADSDTEVQAAPVP
jgi:hypothetical protein